jgi:hypothetical protein
LASKNAGHAVSSGGIAARWRLDGISIEKRHKQAATVASGGKAAIKSSGKTSIWTPRKKKKLS